MSWNKHHGINRKLENMIIKYPGSRWCLRINTSWHPEIINEASDGGDLETWRVSSGQRETNHITVLSRI